MLMLRNLVTSLFEHEQIKTTLPKARDTARLAEKIITLGKRGDRAAYSRATSFLLKPAVVPKLFSTFADRYANRPGGYTRIHKFGNRKGDNAPQAILELVDNQRDLKWEMTSRAIGWELLKDKLKSQRPEAIINSGADETRALVEQERSLPLGSKGGILRPKTRWNLQKVLRFRDNSATPELSKKVDDYFDQLLATPVAFRTIHEQMKQKNIQNRAPNRRAGEAAPGETRPALNLAQGALGHQRLAPNGRILTTGSIFKQKSKYS